MTQGRPVDKGADLPEPARMRLGQAISDALDDKGIQAATLARMLPLDPGQLSRIINGKLDNISVGRVVQIERALGLPNGHLFRAAGLVDEEASVRDRLVADDRIAGGRQTVLNVYDMVARETEAQAPATATNANRSRSTSSSRRRSRSSR